jgi:tetratricopeptide (TPR) repeat protein
VSGKLYLATGSLPEAEAAYKSARDQLNNEKASPRRLAQANYGLAVVAYGKQKDAEALQYLSTVIVQDPSIYAAYLFDADLDKDKVKAFEMAKEAVKFNADYPRAWHVLGKLAAKNHDKPMLAAAIEKLEKLAPGSEELLELQKTKLK